MPDEPDDQRTGSEGQFLELEVALARLKALGDPEDPTPEHDVRERLVRLLEDLEVEARRVLSTLGTRCPFCRSSPADMVGQCAKCGGDACTNCATAYQGVILHRATCAAFYGGAPDT